MKTPAFWTHKTILSTLLLPLSWGYALATLMRHAVTKPVDCGIPVICVGNLTAGGSGKTPLALFIGEYLKNKNIRAFFLSRGYGGTLTGPILVDPHTHSAHDVGDEPLLLARVLPTVICRDRVKGAAYAVTHGANLIVMDDGFQNPSLKKSLSLLVIDSAIGLGNGRLIPAGPLRESPKAGLERANAIVIINRAPLFAYTPAADKPLFFATVHATASMLLAGKPVIAFCGIAYPQKFFDTLVALDATLISEHCFADHYHYRPEDIAPLIQRARAHNAMLVTTAKDAVRLPPDIRAHVTVVDMTLRFDSPAALESLIESVIAQ